MKSSLELYCDKTKLELIFLFGNEYGSQLDFHFSLPQARELLGGLSAGIATLEEAERLYTDICKIANEA